ncbi:MAG TPA: glycoside hydrolase family 28 protein [Opitutaceae bacterium]|nr:glycoside hydrolase family 28 protein [Opitutaceae bacterium]
MNPQLCSLALVLAVVPGIVGSAAAAAPTRTFSIRDSGAVGDSHTLNTAAIQSAIDRAAQAGGGTVVVPTGTFLSGALFLKQGVNLHLERGGTLKGSDQLKDYLPPGVSETERGRSVFALINAENLTGFTLDGDGTIDGNGQHWWDEYWVLRNAKDPDLAFKTRRPKLIRLTSCRDVRVAGLHLQNQAVWCLHFQYCENAVAEDLIIRAGHTAPSSDGIDVDSCRHTRITRCDIDVNDDDISIKAGVPGDGTRPARPCEDVLIEHCRFGYGHGGVAMGSETFGGIRNVEVRDCLAEDDNFAPIRFKSTPARSGVVENIVFRNLQMHGVRRAIEINMDWASGTSGPQIPAKVLPVFRHFEFINVSGTAQSAGFITGLKDSPVQDVTFSNVKVTADTGLTLTALQDANLSGLALEVKQGDAVIRK